MWSNRKCQTLEKKKIKFDIKISFVQVLPLRQQRLEYVLGRIGLQIEMIRLQMIQKHDMMFIIFNNNHASLALSDLVQANSLWNK